MDKEKDQEELKRKALALEKRGRMVLESKLQSDCVKWWKNNYPEIGMRLFANFNEGRDVTHKIAMGLTPGVCDLLYVGQNGMLYGFELKQKGTSHHVNHLITQCEWMLQVLPNRAWFCDSLEGFKEGMFGNDSKLYRPFEVLEYLRKCKKKLIQWDEISDYLKGKRTTGLN